MTKMNCSKCPMIIEYLDRIHLCDECVASIHCTVNGLRKSREKQSYCRNNIESYVKERMEGAGFEKL